MKKCVKVQKPCQRTANKIFSTSLPVLVEMCTQNKLFVTIMLAENLALTTSKVYNISCELSFGSIKNDYSSFCISFNTAVIQTPNIIDQWSVWEMQL